MTTRLATRSGPTGTDRASGLLSTSFGVMVVLSLLAFSTHVLVNLWVRSTVQAEAQEAAIAVATSNLPDNELAAVAEAAIAEARSDLGQWGERVSMEFERDPSGDTVRLRVRAETLRLLPAVGRVDPGPGPLDTTIVVRRERPGAPR